MGVHVVFDHDRGISQHLGLEFVGLDWQRSLASATLRGVGRDAAYVVRRFLDLARLRIG
ncbi:hypothetical protein ACWGE0_11855 [Lentzea sp. NPDC054927]